MLGLWLWPTCEEDVITTHSLTRIYTWRLERHRQVKQLSYGHRNWHLRQLRLFTRVHCLPVSEAALCVIKVTRPGVHGHHDACVTISGWSWWLLGLTMGSTAVTACRPRCTTVTTRQLWWRQTTTVRATWLDHPSFQQFHLHRHHNSLHVTSLAPQDLDTAQ